MLAVLGVRERVAQLARELLVLLRRLGVPGDLVRPRERLVRERDVPVLDLAPAAPLEAALPVEDGRLAAAEHGEDPGELPLAARLVLRLLRGLAPVIPGRVGGVDHRIVLVGRALRLLQERPGVVEEIDAELPVIDGHARFYHGSPVPPGVGELRSAMANREFVELQQRLRALWPSVTLRSIGDVERTVVVVHSISMDVPDQLIPVFPAYEERFLCLVLSLLRSRSSRVIYVTSQPILPRLIDYYFGLVPELDTPDARSRFAVVSLVDGRNMPLTKKLLQRPGAIERIRALVAQPELAFLLPFATSRDEVELAVRLGIPLYGADPALEWLGTKSGSRRVFAEEGVPHAYGFDVGGEADVLRALRELRSGTAVLKLDRGVSGLGNALVDVRRALDDGRLGGALELEDTEAAVADYLGRARRPGRDRRGADRGRRLSQPERTAPHQPFRPGRHPLHARSGPRGAARPDVLRLPLPRGPRVRAADRGRSAQGRAPTGA